MNPSVDFSVTYTPLQSPSNCTKTFKGCFSSTKIFFDKIGSILISAIPLVNFPVPESVNVISGDSGQNKTLF